jgi:hypothetical protein
MALSVCGAAALLTLALVVAGVPESSSRVQAQSGAASLGSSTCTSSECHGKSGEAEWFTSKPGGQEHRAAFLRLTKSADVSMKYAKEVGLADYKDPAGMCVKCHGTYVARSKTYEGVGCEGCHGPSSGYREYHSQKTTDYAGSVQRGLRDLKGKPTKWTGVCRDCHVLDKNPAYEKLLEAGHKDGARWNVSAKFVGVQTHWKKVSYTAAVIKDAAAGKNVVVAVAPSAPPPVTAAPPAAPPLAAVTPPAGPSPSPGTSPPGTAPVTAKPPAPGAVTPPSKPVPVPPNPAPVTTVAPPPAASAPLPVADAVSPLSLAPPPPVTATGLLAAFQDRVEGLLESLLRRNIVPAVPLKRLAPAPALSGPDAELLRLQYEALGLAIEALNLRVKPAAPGPPK